MSARDKFHNTVRNALIKDGWTITHDPLTVKSGKRDLQIDLGAEQLIAATKSNQKIAIEVKSFLNDSTITDFYAALGQTLVYKEALWRVEPDRTLYLAAPKDVSDTLFRDDLIATVIRQTQIKLLIYNPLTEEIDAWQE